MRDAAPQQIFDPPERFNIAEYFLGDRIREGRGDRRALLTDDGETTYAEVDVLANRYGHLLRRAGVRPEERVLIALPDGPDFVGALFGALRIGAVGVMLNPYLRRDEISYFFRYTRGAVLFVGSDRADAFREAASLNGADAGAGSGISAPRETFVVDRPRFRERLDGQPATLDPYPTHRHDPALWLFSGGTTGRPKGVVQTHASFANTTECYGKRVLGLTEDDITLSVPKLFFGYATGSNLFFPFSVGATAALFPERCSPDVLFGKIARFRPTVLVNVPTMIRLMVAHPDAGASDLSCLRLATSAGEALPPSDAVAYTGDCARRCDHGNLLLISAPGAWRATQRRESARRPSRRRRLHDGESSRRSARGNEREQREEALVAASRGGPPQPDCEIRVQNPQRREQRGELAGHGRGDRREHHEPEAQPGERLPHVDHGALSTLSRIPTQVKCTAA